MSFTKANALSTPPGKYGRKTKTQRNRREPAQAVEHVVQFDGKRRTSPRFDMLAFYAPERVQIRKEANTGAAWLSSARVVRCWVKSSNERNPHAVLTCSQQTAPVNGEEGGDDVKSAWPLCLGLHTCYNGVQQWGAK